VAPRQRLFASPPPATSSSEICRARFFASCRCLFPPADLRLRHLFIGLLEKQQWRRVVAQREGMSAAPVGVKGMHPFPLRLPRTLALGSHPRPGPGGARCTGAQRLPEIQILGRVMPPSSHACQVCQWSQSPSWPSTTSCSRC